MTFLDRVALRFLGRLAMEHSSPEALKRYLDEHPGADRKNHNVSKSDTGSSSNNRNFESLDKRSQEADKAFSTLQALKTKADNAEPSARKKFDKAYDRVGEAGVAVKNGVEKVLKALGASSSEEAEHLATNIQTNSRRLDAYLRDHSRDSKEFHSHKKLQTAEQTQAAIQSLNSLLQEAKKLG